MEDWEFLIQKEGDRTWLPLETPDVEVLEGRYRVVARSSRADETVEIRVSYEATAEVPSRRRVQKRTRQINAEGLMVVIPFTRLKPGLWELTCTSVNEATGEADDAWQYHVNLDVLPIELEEPAPFMMPAEEKPIEIPASPPTTGRVIPLKRPAPEPPPPTPAPSTEPSLPLLRIVLDRSIYIRQGPNLTIAGMIEVAQTEVPVLPVNTPIIQIQLRDPQTSQLIFEVREPLPKIKPPIPFACAVNIPDSCDSRLILGEIRFSDGIGEPLSTQPFTIAAEIEDLLEVVSLNVTEEELMEMSQDPSGRRLAEALDQSFESVLKTIQNPKPVYFQPSTASPLPPLLSKNPYKSTHPSVTQYPATSTPPAKPQPPTFPPPEVREPARPVEETAPPEPISESEPTLPPPQPTPPTIQPTLVREDQAFQALKLTDKFFSRLNSLANDEELPELLKLEEMPTRRPQAQLPKTITDWEAQEIVIDDEPVEPTLPKISRLQPVKPTPDLENLFLLPEDQAVPMPVLDLPKDQLISGRPVSVIVRLPELHPRIYVKVWLQDRQTRLILDGPHWVTEFISDIWGNQEATIELLIPYGSLEVQFEAIAMEVQTKRESHKVSLSRNIVPPGPPKLPNES